MTLNATHRCDSCGAQAYATALFKSADSLLLFCSHHWRKFGPKIREVALEFHDETERLYAEATTSSTGEDHA